MNEVLQEFIKTKQEEYARKQKKDYELLKEKTLKELGLVEIVYSPDNKYSYEYVHSKWDKENNCNRFYKLVPIAISDEEFEELIKSLPPESQRIDEEPKSKSTIATLLKVFAWIVYISGFIAGFILGADRWGDPTFLVLVYWLAFFATGTMYIGFAKVIELLCEIKDNTSK